MTGPSPTHAAIDAVWRIESARIVAVVARRVRDIGVAEDCAQEALEEAIAHWPRDGLPERPGAWLTTVAQRRALDHLRRASMIAEHHERLARDLEALEADVEPDVAERVARARDDDIGDDLLRLVFVACHPVLPAASRTALALKLLCGLSTPEIARAYLVAEPTVAQRIVRAKRALADARVPFEVPRGDERVRRLGSVLETVYLMFNEGYAASTGEAWTRPALCDEALRLARVLAGLMPGEAEALGLLALLEIQASRLAARVDATGRPVLLADQDRRRWDGAAIRRGLDALARAGAAAAREAGPPGRGGPAGDPPSGGDAAHALGSYGLQAAIAACHARAAAFEDTDWRRILGLYDLLAARLPSPVVALNRAVAVSRVDGPEAGLADVDRLRDAPALRDYPWLESVRGDLLERLGRADEARAAFERAAALTRNARDRELLEARARAVR